MVSQEDIICFFIDNKGKWFNRQQIAKAFGNNQCLQSVTNTLSSLANYNKGTGFSVKIDGTLYHIKRRGKNRCNSVYALV